MIPTDAQKYVQRWFDKGQIRVDGMCHIWHGRWHHNQAEAKIQGKRINVKRILYTAHYKTPPNDNAQITLTCDKPLCVNPICMQSSIENKSLLKMARTSFKRTVQLKRKSSHIGEFISARRIKL